MRLSSEQMDVIKENLLLRGQDVRINIALEEMAELTQALMKYKRGEDNMQDIIEEIADCFVVLEGLKPTLNLDDSDIQEMVDSKIARLHMRNQKTKEGNVVK